MKAQGNWNWQGNGRWGTNFVRYYKTSCYQCTTCGMLGDFQHTCLVKKNTGCDGVDRDISTATSWLPGSMGWDASGWTWQKQMVDSDSCPQQVASARVASAQVAPAQVDGDTSCDDDVRDQVIAKCQAARDAQATCCSNIGGTFCDELQADCEIDVCIVATDDASVMDDFIKMEFSGTVIAECQTQKENVNGWRFNIEIPDYETMEPYTLYLCLLLMSLNLICGAYFCCCEKKAKHQYKVVSMINTAAEDDTTDVEINKEVAQFLK